MSAAELGVTGHCPDVACRLQLVDGMAAQGVEVRVGTIRPTSPLYPSPAFTCPHGTSYYMQPTDAQVARWIREGTK